MKGQWLRVVLAITFAILIAHSVSAQPSAAVVGWLLPCINGSPTCSNTVKTTVDFILQQFSQANTVSSVQLAEACRSQCGPSLLGGLNTTLASYATSSLANGCGAPSNPNSLLLIAQATSQFVCYPGDASTGGSAGVCVQRVVSALRSAGLLSQVSSLDPSLKFTGDTLNRACSVLRQQACCFRSWAYLMAAVAQQFCMTDLATEYASLPGRCEVQTGTFLPVSGTCGPGWSQQLLPLLQPRADCGAWAQQPGAAQAVWQGSACAAEQACPADTCGLVCGISLRAQQAVAQAGSARHNNRFSTWVIVYVSVISGVAFLLLLTALMMCCVAHKRKQQKGGGGGNLTDWLHRARTDPALQPQPIANVVVAPSIMTGSIPPSMAGYETSNHYPEQRGSVAGTLSTLPNSPIGRGVLLGDVDPLMVAFASTGPAGSVSMVGSLTGGGSIAHSMGLSSLAGRSNLTIRSIGEEKDRLGPLPAGVSENAGLRMTRVSSDSPIHYANALFGNRLPSETDPSSQCTTPHNTSHSHTQGRLSGGSLVMRSSRSFSFGDEPRRSDRGSGGWNAVVLGAPRSQSLAMAGLNIAGPSVVASPGPGSGWFASKIAGPSSGNAGVGSSSSGTRRALRLSSVETGSQGISSSQLGIGTLLPPVPVSKRMGSTGAPAGGLYPAGNSSELGSFHTAVGGASMSESSNFFSAYNTMGRQSLSGLSLQTAYVTAGENVVSPTGYQSDSNSQLSFTSAQGVRQPTTHP